MGYVSPGWNIPSVCVTTHSYAIGPSSHTAVYEVVAKAETSCGPDRTTGN